MVHPMGNGRSHGSKSSPEALDPMSTTSALEVGKCPPDKTPRMTSLNPPIFCVDNKKMGGIGFVLYIFFEHFHKHSGIFDII